MQVQWLSFPLFIKWYITSKCNLRCKHCYLTDYTIQPHIDEILSLIRYFGERKVQSIALLGGEPLIRDDLGVIVQAIAASNMSIKIATNGILASKKKAKELVDLGCQSFQVSLEGHTPELSDPVRGKDTFFKVVKGAQNLKESGAWVGLAFTLSSENVLSIGEIHRFARELGADQLKLAAFVPVGTGSLSAGKYNLSREMVKVARDALVELQSQYPNLDIDSAFLPRKKNTCGITFGCGAGTTSLVINSDFSVSACDLLAEEDRTKVKLSQPSDIDDIWNHNPLFLKWRGLDPKASTKTMHNFADVHQVGCHVAYNTYRKNLFR
ncbi:MAG: radical SAM protein [Cyanobacteria bacterium]|jgi:MoaA/NifB/PqqE/SkfB family radical SAM enzyme|nr:radical SAM protein [Cyanobacteria bacterium GSL.Bin21]